MLIEYSGPEKNTWTKHIFQGVEMYIYDDGYTMDAFRCEICKEPLTIGKLCVNMGCITILSMMDTDPYRIKVGSKNGRPSI